MAIYLDDDDLLQLVSYADAIEAVEAAFKALANGEATNRPRQRVRAHRAGLNVLVSAYPPSGYFGFKAYSSGPESPGQFNWLYNGDDGSLVAVLQAGWLGLARTSAASAVATRALARLDAHVAAFLGAGRQAVGQLHAISLVREFDDIRCYSPSGKSAAALCDIARGLGLNARVCATPEEAVNRADVVTVATHGESIALQGQWLRTGCHVNAMGVNRGSDREIDAEAVLRSSLIAVDEKQNAKTECGDLLPVIESRQLDWDQVHNLGDILIAATPGRTDAQAITLFESQGLGIEDVAVAAIGYQRAVEKGLGRPLPF